jgi:UDP-glucose-4-epimerase GalE
MKTFVVTGCNGYIGSHMCYELKKAYPDCLIHGVDRVDKKHLRHLYDIFSHIDMAMDFINISPFERKAIDAIFHFAAYISVEEGELRPWKYYHNNVCGTMRLLREAHSFGVKNFIFSSTAAVYGDCSRDYIFGGNIIETQPVNPTSVYGKTKAMCEEILSSLTDMNVARLRYFNACGRNVEANLYEEHDPETHLIPLLARNKKAVIYGNTWATKDGTCVRDYVHVMDICRSHIKAYEYMEKNTGSNFAVNIGSGKGYSVTEVVDKVNKIIYNGNMNIEYKAKRDGDVPYLVADTTLAESMLGFKPEYTLENIIESMKEEK